MRTMDSQRILYSQGKNDECLTLNYGVKPIIKYIPKGATVWCPFDKGNSEFVTVFKSNVPILSIIIAPLGVQ